MTRELTKAEAYSVSFYVPGKPEPGGSKMAYIVKGHAVVADANAKVKPWRSEIVAACQRVYDEPPLRGPLAVDFRFLVSRPKGHYGTGRNAGMVRPGAPSWPTTRPDVLKLARAAEDALTGVLWADDAQIVEERLAKFYAAHSPGLYVTCYALDVPRQVVPMRGQQRFEGVA